MDRPQRAVFFLEEDSSVPEHSKPLMLEAVVFCPILTWAASSCGPMVCSVFCRLRSPFRCGSPRMPAGGGGCYGFRAAGGSDGIPEHTGPGAGFVPGGAACRAGRSWICLCGAGYELQESWKERMTNQVTAAELVSGWLPVFGPDTIAELEPLFRERIVREHQRKGRADPGSQRGLY